jgi:peptidoglycan hydrolase CwlO-like protein
MRKMLGLAVLALLAAGCATSGSVREQINPLSDRVAAVEKSNQDIQAQLAAMNKKLDSQSSDLDTSRKELADMKAAAQQAQQAASDAQAAATRAETAADKAAKAFELRQRKGAR